jgi:3-dehydroquinate dehydratase
MNGANGAAGYAEFIIGRAFRDPVANPPYAATGIALCNAIAKISRKSIEMHASEGPT